MITTDDLERVALVNRLENVPLAGASVIRLRAIPAGITGEQIVIDPGGANPEIRTVSAIADRDLTLSVPLSYAHEVDAIVLRPHLAGGGFPSWIFTSLQAAVTAVGASGGGEIVLPAGTINVPTRIVVEHDNVSIRGQGYKTILLAGATLAESVIEVNKPAGGQTTNFRLSDLQIVITPANVVGVTLYRCIKPVVERVKILGHNLNEVGLWMEAGGSWGYGLSLVHSEIYNCGWKGIQFGTNVSGNLVSGCGIVGAGVPIAGSVGIAFAVTATASLVQGCDIEGWVKGIDFSGTGCAVIGNRFETCTTSIDVPVGADRWIIAGNYYDEGDALVVTVPNPARGVQLDPQFPFVLGRSSNATPALLDVIGNSTTLPVGLRVTNNSAFTTPMVNVMGYPDGHNNAFGTALVGKNQANIFSAIVELLIGTAINLDVGIVRNNITRLLFSSYGVEFVDRDYGLILRSPDGSRWLERIDNAGTATWMKL